MHNWNWDDLKYILAVVEHKSIAAAARVLHVNHATVLRRINSFEKRNGVRLFERGVNGSLLSEAGDDIFQVALELKATISTLERRLAGKENRLAGRIRLTTCDTLMDSLIPSLIAQFTTENPEISFEITTGNYVSVGAQRDSDIAIRTADEIHEMYYGKKALDINFSIYAAQNLSRKYNLDKDILEYQWVIPDITLSGMGIFRWIKKNISDSFIKTRADSLVSLKKLAEAGAGLTILPHYLGDTSPVLQRIPHSEVDQINTGLWVLTHEDLRHSARVRAFMDFAMQKLNTNTKQ